MRNIKNTRKVKSAFKYIISTALIGVLIMPIGYAQGAAHDGKKIWQEKCLSCHSTNKELPQVASYYASVQWVRFIEKSRHAKPQITLNDLEKEQLLSYLKAYAADSDSPEVAGIR